MATLADFRLRISAKLGLDNSVAGDQGLIDSWVNDAVVEILTRARVSVYPGTMSLIAGVFDYDMPTSMLSLDEMFVTSFGTTTSYQMYRKSPLEINQMRIGGAGGTPPVRFYAQNGMNLLMVYPTPVAADVLTIYYVPRPATLVLSTDTPSDVPIEWHKAIEYFGLWQAAQYMDDASSQEGMMYQKLYEGELAMLKRAGLRRGGRKLSRAVVGRRAALVVGSPSQVDV